MKDSLKNIWDNARKWFSSARKLVSTSKNNFNFKNWFPPMTVSASRKKLSSKVTVFIREKNPSPISGMKDSFKDAFPLDRKKSFPRQGSMKKYKKWFVLARKSVSTTRNEAFVGKYVSTIRKNCFFWKENQRKWFPLVAKFFSFKIASLLFQ